MNSQLSCSGVALRIVYDLVVLRHLHLGLDSTWYFLEGGLIRHDHAFTDPHTFLSHRDATAVWPPLYPAYLAVVQSLFGDVARTSQLVGAGQRVPRPLRSLVSWRGGLRAAGPRLCRRRARRVQPVVDRDRRIDDVGDPVRPARVGCALAVLLAVERRTWPTRGCSQGWSWSWQR